MVNGLGLLTFTPHFKGSLTLHYVKYRMVEYQTMGELLMSAEIDEAVLLDTSFLAKFTLGNFELEQEVLLMFIDQSALYLERLKSPKSPRTGLRRLIP